MTEFDAPPDAFQLLNILPKPEANLVPFIAALYDNVLGRGLKFNLIGAWPFATPDTCVGMPKLNVGMLPDVSRAQGQPHFIKLLLAIGMSALCRIPDADVFHSTGGDDYDGT